ncbi:MAG: AlpA family transcriptional regulator [Alphaproteobacteria bacterium]
MSQSILRLKSVLSRTGLSRTVLYVLIKGGNFPPPIKLGKRSCGWLESEIDAWIVERVQASRNKSHSPHARPDESRSSIAASMPAARQRGGGEAALRGVLVTRPFTNTERASRCK